MPTITRISRYLFMLTLLIVTALAVWQTDDLVITTGWDKSNHVLAFFTLLLLADAGWPDSRLFPHKVGGLLCYGLLIEVWQSYLPMRSCSLWDLLADALGMGFYLLLRPPLQLLWLKVKILSFVDDERSAPGEGSCSDQPDC